MPSRKEIRDIETAFDVRDDWFENGIGAVQARASGNSSNFPIGLEEIDNLN